MQRQDEFLRTLLRIIEINMIATPQHGYNLLTFAINERLPDLKPVAYENNDLSSGLSWDGNVICGDAKSIKAVQRALNDADQVEAFWRPNHIRISARLEAIADALK